jgi:putative membrane protein
VSDQLPVRGPESWQRLHPLSPVLRATRVAVPLIVVLALSSLGRQGGGTTHLAIDVAVVAVVVLIGLVNWLVTRWSFDGATLFIETGLFRRDSRRLPVTRIQAVDIVQPFLAGPFGLAELRIRVAGITRPTHLSFLTELQAQQLRAALLAAHHGLDAATPEPMEVPLGVVPVGPLVGSVILSGPTIVFVLVVAGLGTLAAVSSKAAVGVIAVSLAYLVGLGTQVWRRFNDQYGFTVASAPDGIRIRRGLLGTVAETVPIRRVQAVRQIEPLWWRLLGWCRLEVDLAGVPGRDRAAGQRQVTKTLLPVGPPALAAQLRAAVIGTVSLDASAPPRRARLKAPLSYHFLSAAHDDTMAVATTGRLRRVTCWVPLTKAQSVRRTEGPVQRRLGLASVHIDVAGRRVEALFRDRDAAEADELVDRLAVLSRTARRQAPPDLLPRPPVTATTSVPPGWFIDPSGRHAGRYWDGQRWTEHVDDAGVPGIDPI